MKKKTIDVTQRDIDLGKKFSTDCCMVARACKRAGLKNVEVYPWVLYFNKSNFKLPKFVIDKIDSWDAGRKIAPFKFTIKY